MLFLVLVAVVVTAGNGILWHSVRISEETLKEPNLIKAEMMFNRAIHCPFACQQRDW